MSDQHGSQPLQKDLSIFFLQTKFFLYEQYFFGNLVENFCAQSIKEDVRATSITKSIFSKVADLQRVLLLKRTFSLTLVFLLNLEHDFTQRAMSLSQIPVLCEGTIVLLSQSKFSISLFSRGQSQQVFTNLHRLSKRQNLTVLLILIYLD